MQSSTADGTGGENLQKPYSVILKAKTNPKVAFEIVENEFYKRNYGILGTVSEDGRPHSAGVLYAVSPRTGPLSLYVVTDGRSKKARNIARNPNVSFVIPIPRRLGFLPPNSIQFQGKAKLLALSDDASNRAFGSSLVLKRVLELQLAQKRDVSTFIQVQPDPVIFTYGVGVTIFQLMKHVEGAASRVEIPQERTQDNPFVKQNQVRGI